MISKTTEMILKKFGCLRCNKFLPASGGRGSKAQCIYSVEAKAIRYLKRCPKR